MLSIVKNNTKKGTVEKNQSLKIARRPADFVKMMNLVSTLGSLMNMLHKVSAVIERRRSIHFQEP